MHAADNGIMRLSDLAVGERGQVITLPPVTPDERCIARRLVELGFSEGSAVELLHRAPMGGDPIAVSVDAVTIALRLNEARQIGVRRS